MTLTPAKKAIIALIIANSVWGAGAPIFKLAMQTVPPFTLAFCRFFFSSMILLILFGPKVVNAKELFQKDFRKLLLYTLFGITINITFYFWGINKTLSINAPVIASTAPILTLLIALVILKEKFVVRKFVGMLCGLIGILVIVLEPLLVAGGIGGSLLGNLFLILAMAGAVGQSIVGHTFIYRHNPFKITFWSNFIGGFTFLPMAMVELHQNPHLYSHINGSGYFGIFWGTVFSSVIGYGLFAWGISKIHASEAALFTYIDPVIGAIMSYIILHEKITPLFLLGSLFIFIGIFIAEKRIHYHPLSRLLRKNE